MNNSTFNLENRTFLLPKQLEVIAKWLRIIRPTYKILKQIVRSSGSVAANYIEANESLSKNDFIYRIKICRKEAKETKLWLNLIDIEDKPNLEPQRNSLSDEATQLMLIFNAIIKKSV